MYNKKHALEGSRNVSYWRKAASAAPLTLTLSPYGRGEGTA